MPGAKDYKPNTYERPVNQVLVELKELQDEYGKTLTLFRGLCERLEQCAYNINNCITRASRDLFKSFMNKGVMLGNYIKFTDTKNPNAIYQVVGIDAEGFWIRLLPDGEEYHLKLFAHADRIGSIKRVRSESYELRKLFKPSAEISLMETGHEEKMREEAFSNYNAMNASYEQKEANEETRQGDA